MTETKIDKQIKKNHLNNSIKIFNAQTKIKAASKISPDMKY